MTSLGPLLGLGLEEGWEKKMKTFLAAFLALEGHGFFC